MKLAVKNNRSFRMGDSLHIRTVSIPSVGFFRSSREAESGLEGARRDLDSGSDAGEVSRIQGALGSLTPPRCMRVSMRRSAASWPSISLGLSLVVLGLGARPALAQGGPTPLTWAQFGVGYVGNAPDMMVGASAHVILPTAGGIGLYVDTKFDQSSPKGKRGYDPNVTAPEVVGLEGSRYVKTDERWESFNVALIRPLNSALWLYAGGGVARVVRYDLYDVDPDAGIGYGGVAWLENPSTAETRANLMVGIMMRLSSRLSAQFGYETQPDGVTVGASVRLPRW